MVGPTHCVPTNEADAHRVYRKTNMYVTSFYSLCIQGGRHIILIVCHENTEAHKG